MTHWTRWTLLLMLSRAAPRMVGWETLLAYGPRNVTYQMVRRLRRDHRVPVRNHRGLGYSVPPRTLGQLLGGAPAPAVNAQGRGGELQLPPAPDDLPTDDQLEDLVALGQLTAREAAVIRERTTVARLRQGLDEPDGAGGRRGA